MGKTFEMNTLEEMCDNNIPKEYDRCLRCGRKLKTFENRARGFGKVCWEKSKKNAKNSKKLFTFGQICIIINMVFSIKC